MADGNAHIQGQRIHRGGARRVIEPTAEVLERLYQYGFDGMSQKQVAVEFNVSPETITNFFNRAPEARARFKQGFDDGAGDAQEARRRAFAHTSRALPPKEGETCLTCGRVYRGPEVICYTQEEFDEARRKFEDMIERHIAAWEGGEDDEDEEDEEGEAGARPTPP
jgi:hypothetical protein